MKFEEKLVKLRKTNGLSQEDLAERLGVSRQAVSRWELGSTTPDLPNLKQLSEVFGVSADYLINDNYESDDDIPKVKESKQIINEKDAKQSKTYLGAACTWTFAVICWIIAAIISFNYLHIVCICLGVYLAGFNFYNYRKAISNGEK